MQCKDFTMKQKLNGMQSNHDCFNQNKVNLPKEYFLIYQNVKSQVLTEMKNVYHQLRYHSYSSKAYKGMFKMFQIRVSLMAKCFCSSQITICGEQKQYEL